MQMTGVLMVLISYSSVGETQNTPAHTPGKFSKDVENLLHDLLKEIDGVDGVINNGRAKFADCEFDDWDIDHKLAGIIVYMYTSPNNITNVLTDTLNRRLNQALIRHNQPVIWKRFAEVLSDALDRFGNETYREVFRGEKSQYPSALSGLECSRRFYSTTLDPAETKTFGGQYGIFYHILNVTGTDIHKLSTLSEEKEVLIKPGTCFIRVYSTGNTDEIRRKMMMIQISHNHFHAETFLPKQFIVLKPTHAIIETGTSGCAGGHDCGVVCKILIFIDTITIFVKAL